MAKRSLTPSEAKTIDLYTSLMEDFKIRIAAINTLVGGKTGLIDVLVQESCYLQFRFMCELIAIACLVAHGDINETHATKFRDRYEADRILKQLEGLLADFYPFPSKITKTDKGQEVFLIKEGNFIKKPELIKL